MYRSAPYDTSVAPGPDAAAADSSGWPREPLAADAGPDYRSSMVSNPSDDPGEAYVSRTLYICKLPPDFTEAQIHEICSPFGDLRKITCYPSRQIAFAEYWDIRDAQRARNELHEVYINGRLVEIQYSKTKDDRAKDRNTGTLYVRPLTTDRNFHDPNTLQQYKDLFARFGEVKKVNTNRKRDAEKFIEYHDLRAADEALEALNGMDFNGVKLEVQFANQSSKTINKDGVPEFAPSGPKRDFRRGDSAPSYGPIREERWGPPIKLKWLGTAGPTATMSAMFSSTAPSADFLGSNAFPPGQM